MLEVLSLVVALSFTMVLALADMASAVRALQSQLDAHLRDVYAREAARANTYDYRI